MHHHTIEYALHLQVRSGLCTVFGVDVQVLIGTKRNEKPHSVYPDTTLITPPRLVVEVLSPGTEVREVQIEIGELCRGLEFDEGEGEDE